jgi:hypothetical protein
MRQFFTEESNRLSMKRLCAFVGTLSLCATMIAKPTEASIYAVTFFVSSALGFSSAEKIFRK